MLKNKKFFCIFLLSFLMLTLFAITAGAEEIDTSTLGTPVETWDISATEADNVIASMYKNSEGKNILVISGNGAMKDWDDLYENPWYIKSYSFVSVHIGNGIVNIGNNAFYYAIALTSVTIPNSVKEIGNNAFDGCKSITSLEIPDSVTVINRAAFSGCLNLKSIVLPNGLSTINSGVFSECSSLIDIVIPAGVTCVDERAFNKCTSLVNITIPDRVISIGNSAFYGCSALANISIPNGVSSVGTSAFACCSSLSKIVIPDSVTSIGNSAFNGCSSLTDIVLSNNITCISDYLFYRCTSLRNIVIPNGVIDIGYSAFEECRALANVLIPNSVTTIRRTAFYECDSLTSVVIPDGVKSIEENAFGNCDSLASVIISDSVTTVESYAFSSCPNLIIYAEIGSRPDKWMLSWARNIKGTVWGYYYDGWDVSAANDGSVMAYLEEDLENEGYYTLIFSGAGSMRGFDSHVGISSWYPLYGEKISSVIIERGITNIGDNAFKDEYAYLTSFEIPASVTTIGISALSGCVALTSIELPDSINSIGDYAFSGCKALSKLVIRENVASVGYRIVRYGASDFTVYVENGTLLSGWDKNWSVGASCTIVWGYYIDGWDLSVEKDGSVMAYIEEDLANEGCYILSVKGAGNMANFTVFPWTPIYGKKLTGVLIDNGITSIGERAFYNCVNLTSVTIPDSVTQIYNGAFYGCGNLITVDISATSNLLGVGSDAFGYCSNLKNITLPESVVGIGSYAFYYCKSLPKINIPSGVSSLGTSAFNGCGNLKAVYITDLSAWCKMSLDKFSSPLPYADLYLNGNLVTDLVIPDDVTSISNYAFYGCRSITSVNISDSVTKIGYSAFQNCENLKSVKLSNSINGLRDFAFYGCASLSDITIPEKVTNVDKTAFSGCTSLIEQEDGVSYVDRWIVGFDNTVAEPHLREDTVGIAIEAFYKCTALTGIKLPDSLLYLGAHAFYGCTALKSLTIGENLKNFGDIAFFDCSAMETIYYNAVDATYASNHPFRKTGEQGPGVKVYIGKDVKNLPSSIFSTGGYFSSCIVSIEFEENSVCETIGNSAFAYCSALKSITLPDSITSIGTYAFKECSSLEYIEMPNGVITIANYTFENCVSLKSIKWPDNLVAIGYSAFNYCSGLEEIEIPNTVKSIGDSAFNGCVNLKKVKLSDSVIEIGAKAFYTCESLNQIYIPSSVRSVEYNAFAPDQITIYCEAEKMPSTWDKSIAGATFVFGHAAHDYMICLKYNETMHIFECVCGAATEKIPHTEAVIEAVRPTPSKEGHSAGIECAECGAVIKAPVVAKVTQMADTRDPNFKIASASLDLAESICVFYKSVVTSGYNNAYMVFVFGGEEFVVNDYTIEEGTGRYVYRFTGAPAYKMAENIEAYVYAETAEGEYAVNVVLEYSVMTYCVNQLKANASNPTYVTVLSDVLTLGAANQMFEGYKTNELVTDLVAAKGYTLTPTEYKDVEASKNVQAVLGDRTTGTDWKSANMLLGSNIKVQLKFETDSVEDLLVVVTIGDVSTYFASDLFTRDGDRYVVTVDYLTSKQYNEKIVATFVRNGEQVGSTLTYSVNSYIYRNVGSATEAKLTLLKAIYVYGETMKAYFTKK